MGGKGGGHGVDKWSQAVSCGPCAGVQVCLACSGQLSRGGAAGEQAAWARGGGKDPHEWHKQVAHSCHPQPCPPGGVVVRLPRAA